MADIYLGNKATLAAGSLAAGDYVVVIDISAGDIRLVQYSGFASLFDAAGAASAAQAASQPLDSDLTAIAALSTTAFGRSLLTQADAAALRQTAEIPESFIIALGDETTVITTGTAKVTFRMPYAFTVTGVRSSLTTASSSGLVTVDINEAGTTILSTKLSIDANEKTSTTAVTPAVISDASLADDAEITLDIDAAGTNATGLKVVIIGRRA